MEGDLQRQLGENLRAYRVVNGLSQEELADRLRVSRGYVSALERGERNLTLQVVERLSDSVGSASLVLLGPDFQRTLKKAARIPPKPLRRTRRDRGSGAAR